MVILGAAAAMYDQVDDDDNDDAKDTAAGDVNDVDDDGDVDDDDDVNDDVVVVDCGVDNDDDDVNDDGVVIGDDVDGDDDDDDDDDNTLDGVISSFPSSSSSRLSASTWNLLSSTLMYCIVTSPVVSVFGFSCGCCAPVVSFFFVAIVLGFSLLLN